MTTIPDSFKPSDLEALLESAPAEQPKYDPENKSKEYLEDRAEEIVDLIAEMSPGPLLPKVVALRIINQLMHWHTDVGVKQFEHSDERAGIAWIRDAGKLQAAISQLLEVTLGPSDVWTDDGVEK